MYDLRLRPKRSESHFERGIYFHELKHFYYHLIQAGYKINSPELIDAMDSKLRQDMEEIHFDHHGIMLQVHLMFRRFLEREKWVLKLDSDIEILHVEYELYYALNELIALHGFADLIYRRKGRTVIRDHKTGENRSAHTMESIAINDQLLTYAVIWWLTTGEIPIIEISWFNSKVDYKERPSLDQIFNRVHKSLDEEYLKGYWNYLQEYVYHMQTVPAIRALNDWKCKNCPYVEPCVMSLKGQDISNLLKANYKEVSRNHDYAKFTELAKKSTNKNSENKASDDSSGGLIINIGGSK